MGKTLEDYIFVYKKELEKGDIQIAYESLIKYVMALKAACEKAFSKEFTFGNVSQGYMDFTYFSFYNSFVRKEKLRFGIVLNHQKLRFELWLMGQNGEVQKQYWELLKNTKWNQNQPGMPKYSVLEAVVKEKPDFDNLPQMTDEVVETAEGTVQEILEHLQKLK